MSSSEQLRVAAELRAAAIEAMRKAEELDPNRDAGRPRRSKAPDGGPESSAHMFVTPRLLRTVKVNRTGDDGTVRPMIINQSDFNAETDELLEELPRKRVRVEVPNPKDKYGTQTREELLTMTMKSLSLLPEYADLDDPPAGKPELVDAILRQRIQ